MQFLCTALPLICHLFPATTEAFFPPWDEPFHSLLLEIPVLCYRPPCYNGIVSNIYKCVVPKVLVLLQHCTQMIVLRDHNRLCARFSRLPHYEIGLIIYRHTEHVVLKVEYDGNVARTERQKLHAYTEFR